MVAYFNKDANYHSGECCKAAGSLPNIQRILIKTRTIIRRLGVAPSSGEKPTHGRGDEQGSAEYTTHFLIYANFTYLNCPDLGKVKDLNSNL